MRILLINAGNEGHCVELVSLFFRELMKCYPVVDSLTSFPEELDDPLSGCNYCIPSGEMYDIQCQYSFVADFLSYQQVGYDLIIFFTFDEILMLSDAVLASLYSSVKLTPVTGVYYSSSYHRVESQLDWCLHRERRLDKFNIPLLFTPDLGVHISHRSIYRLHWLPDFTSAVCDHSANILTNQILRQKKGRQVVLLAGSLGKWKGIYELLEALYKDRHLVSKYLFVFSGKIVDKTFTSSELEAIHFWMDELGDAIVYNHVRIREYAGFNSIVDAADIIYAVYKNPQSSGLVSKAILLNKKILCGTSGFVPELMDFLQYPHQKININKIDSAKVAMSLNALSTERMTCCEVDDYKALLKISNSVEIFVNTVNKVVWDKSKLIEKGFLVRSFFSTLLKKYLSVKSSYLNWSRGKYR